MAEAAAAHPTEHNPAADADQRQAEMDAEAALVRKYGSLPKANPIFAHSIKSQKHYFDSGDYQLQQQGALDAAGLPDYGDLSQRPLAYDHHARTGSEGDKLTSQPPRLDKRPGSGSHKGSRAHSPRGVAGGSGSTAGA